MPQQSWHRFTGSDRIVVCILLASALFPLCATAQRLSFQQLTVRDGLASNYITALEQGTRGRLWIGTADGVSVYDGDRCATMTRRDGLPGNYISRLLRRPAGGMYAIAGGRAVSIEDGRRETERVQLLPLRGGGQAPPVTDLASASDGSMWAVNADGLLRLVGDTLLPVRGTQALGGAHCLRGDNRGRLWLLHQRGVLLFDPSTNVIRLIDSLPGRYVNIYSIREGRAGQMLVCARDSTVTEFRDASVFKRHRFPNAQPQDLIRDETGTWWIGTTRGLFSTAGPDFNPSEITFHDFRDNYSGIEINVLMQDRERNIWYASAGMGVGWLEDRATLYFAARDMTGKGTQDPRGRLWLSSHRGIWECWRDTSGVWNRRLHEHGPGWPGGYTYHVQAVGGNRLYVSFHGHAIAEFDIARASSPSAPLRLQRVIAPSKTLPVPDPFCFLVDRHDQLWMKTRAGNLAIIALSGQPTLLRRIPKPHPDIRVMFEDSDGSVWIGGYDSAPVQFAGSHPASAQPRRRGDLGQISARALLRDHAQRLWIGTMGGVVHGTEGKWRTLNSDNGLPNERVFALAQGKDGRIWFGTQIGMVAYDPRSGWIDPQLELTDNPVGACGVLDDGTLWLATAFGLTVHDQRRGVADTVAPVPYLRALHVNERPLRFADGMEFAARENNFRFEFSVPHLRKARHVRLEYQLAGVDSSWSAPTGERSLTFRSLPPGTYDLLVRARNSAGIASREPLHLHFIIRVPFWRQWWFFAGVVLLLLGTVLYFVRLRVRGILENERIRARIAADLHDDIGTGLTRIAMMTDMMHQQTAVIRRDGENAGEVQAALESTLQRSGVIARELIENMSDVVWSLDPRNESLMQVADRLRVFAYDLTEAREIALSFDIQESLQQAKAEPEVSRSLLMVIKEALNNAVRHAAPTSIRVSLYVADNRLHFSIEDDGLGFDPAGSSRRSGLKHMEDRARASGGKLLVESKRPGGTSITGSLPLQPKN
jgi:ligand-binding sensor domain-containing protein/signal transduction histidine kinase